MMNDGQKQEYKKFQEKTQDIITLSSNDYFYFKKYFKQNVKHNDSKEIELKIKNKIYISFEKIINNFIDFEDFKDLIEKILLNLGIETDKIENLKFNLKKRIIKGLKTNYIKVFDSLIEITKQLNELKDHKYIEKMKEEISFFKNFIKGEIKLRIPILGCYSCGKSSLLNSLIGIDLLPVDTEVSTNVGLVLNYTKSIKDICLLKTYLNKSVNNFEDYYYFCDSIKIYSKLEFMREIIFLMNKAFLFKDVIVNVIITFIKKLDVLKIISKNVIYLIHDILVYKKEENLKKFDLWFHELDEQISKDLDKVYKNLMNYLNEIIKSEKNNDKNKGKNKFSRENENNTFLKLNIPIIAFDELNLSEEEKKEIELFDFPGLNSDNNLLDKAILNPLIKFSNGFIFLTKCSINEGDTSDVINTIITKIGNRKMFDFSFDSILFVLTLWEKLSKLNLEEKENDIYDSINLGDLTSSFLLNQNKFLITKFSNDYYKKFLIDKYITENITKVYSHLKKYIKCDVNDIKYVKTLKKGFNDSFLCKIVNKNVNNIPLDDEFNSTKNKLINQISANSLTHEYISHIDEMIKNYFLFKKNISQHQLYIKSNAPDFYNQFLKLIKNSRKSYKKNLEKSIIYFALYLQDKLEKINMNFIFKKANEFIKEKDKNQKINEIKSISENSLQIINNKLDSYKQQFNDEISSLTDWVSNNKIDNERIQRFSAKWKANNDKFQSQIQNDIIEYASKLEEKIPINISIKTNDFKEQKNFAYFDAGHIAAHGIALGLEGVRGAISAIVATNITAPGIGVAIRGGILIHLTICLIKLKLKEKKEKDKLIESIFNYSNNFMDNLNVFGDEVNNIIIRERDNIINQINDNYLLGCLQFEKNEEDKLKEIIESFENILNDNFKIDKINK